MAHFALLYNDSELSLLSRDMGGTNVAQIALPAGTVAGGRISNPNQFGELIAQTMSAAQPHAIRGTSVLIGLPDEQAFLKTISLPKKIKNDELQQVLEYQWQNLLPITRDQVYYAYRELPPVSKDETDQRVFILAYPKDIIDGVIAALGHVGLTPEKLVPQSSCLAEIIPSHPEGATLVLDTQSGEDVAAIIIEQKIAQFSTKVHAPVTTSECAKMISNIVSFYEKSVPGEVVVKECVILPNAFQETLQQQMQTFNLPTTFYDIKKSGSLSTATGHLGALIALEGLLHSHTPLTLVPPLLQASQTETREHVVLRATATYVVTSLVLMIYLSLVFMAALQFNIRNQPHYAPDLLTRITKEKGTITEQIKQANLKINRLAASETVRTQTATLLQSILTTAQQTTGIKPTKIMVDKTTANQTTVTLAGTSTDTTSLVAFIAQLQSAQPHAAISSPTTSGTAPITFTLTLTFTGAGS